MTSARVPSDPDIAAIPDLSSFTPVPWDSTVARFACDVTVEGEPWPADPGRFATSSRGRTRQASSSRSASSSSTSSSAAPRTAGSSSPTRSTTPEKPCYDLRGLTRNYEFLTTISRYVNGLGWGNYANDHEDANGQFEQNFTYDDALVSCTRDLLPLHGAHAGPAAGHARDVHAQAVHAPDGERLPFP